MKNFADMLGHPVKPLVAMGAKNPVDRDDQQGRRHASPSETECKALGWSRDDATVRPPWKHGEAGGNDLSHEYMLVSNIMRDYVAVGRKVFATDQ